MLGTTKIWTIKDSLSRVVDYASNPNKTIYNDLKEVLHYAGNKHKTESEEMCFVTGVNCNADTALEEMERIKRRFDKEGGNLAYYAYQSFKTGEVSRELCHEIGVKLAQKMWGTDYQVVVATHLDTNTLPHNVHFVAIANNVDSNDQSSNEFAPFLNIMNEWYLRDLSRKQKAAIRVKGESGKPITNMAIYGYKKDPNDKNHWLIDEEAAEVVRKIFRLTIEGNGPYKISRMLFEEKIETPAVYAAKQGRGIWKNKEEFVNPYGWNGFIVGQIISKQEYCGDTVDFRSHKQSYKDKNAVPNPKEDWMIFKDTHEAIIDRETWELAQRLRKTKKRADTVGEANPLTGLIYCADCGAKMFNHRTRGNPEKGSYPADYYDCSTYTLGKQRKSKACFGHYTSTKAIREIVLETIRYAST